MTITIPVPPIETQIRISRLLSNYDKLFDNNKRRIEIAAQTARMIYREWFVRFRFPGHEKVKMVDSKLGKIPVAGHVLS